MHAEKLEVLMPVKMMGLVKVLGLMRQGVR
jgi:hypothetical protein